MSETHEDSLQDSIHENLDDNLENLQDTSQTQLLSAEYKDGQLQIVEVAPFDKSERQVMEGSLPVLQVDENTKYVQVLDSDKNMMQLDLLNLTLVRCEDGVESYRLVSNMEAGDSSADATVTCVLHSSDTEAEAESSEAYVVMEGDSQGPLVFLQSALPQARAQEPKPKPAVIREHKLPAALTPTEILEKAKALQKAKQQIMQSQAPTEKLRRGRKRKSELPPPHELLASPNFKLFLYSCKLCSFKCNAVKEMTAHKTKEHSSSSGAGGKWRSSRSNTALQCALCPFKATTHSHVMKHVQDMHRSKNNQSYKVILDSDEVEAADVLVCGACGFESASRPLFRAHIERVHGATVC